MELFNTSTPEKAFKTSVRPLGGLMIIQSILLLYVFTGWAADSLVRAPIPFVPDPYKKIFMISSAVLILVIGVGLFVRSKKLWYVFVAYLFVTPIYFCLGMAFDYFKNPGPKEIVIPIVGVVSILISTGLYSVTRPAFK